MADKSEKKPEPPAAAAVPAAEQKPGGGIMSRTPVLLGGVMLLEALLLVAAFKYLTGTGPQAAVGAELTELSAEAGPGGAAGEKGSTVEINVLAFRAPNKLSGRTFLYDVSIYAVARAEHEQRVRQTIDAREATIKDRIRTIVAQSDPEKLGGGSEPGLETLRRQVKHQLDEIIGEGLVVEVLIPRCIPFRADF